MEGSYADHYTTNASRGINMETRGFTISSTIDNDILVQESSKEIKQADLKHIFQVDLEMNYGTVGGSRIEGN